MCFVNMQFEEVVYKVKTNGGDTKSCFSFASPSVDREKNILNGITGVVRPGEILAMLGPSGSGKTTLLTALGGRLNANKHRGLLSGKITYNSQGFSGPVRRRMGFVPQEDVFYPHLTVRDTLFFNALLRLPSSLSPSEKAAQAEQVMVELGLGRVADSVVGGPRLRGISGGEKKRLSIGLEMLVNPSLLLVDEPTSGLDSTTAQRIITTLKRMANSGRTVVTTIHQPSSRIYYMFDKVILLSQGSPIYSGRASSALDYFTSIGFSSTATVNPADLMLDLANGRHVNLTQSIYIYI